VGRRDGQRPTLLPRGDGALVRRGAAAKRLERKKARVFFFLIEFHFTNVLFFHQG
jgi:hypothetical protein